METWYILPTFLFSNKGIPNAPQHSYHRHTTFYHGLGFPKGSKETICFGGSNGSHCLHGKNTIALSRVSLEFPQMDSNWFALSNSAWISVNSDCKNVECFRTAWKDSWCFGMFRLFRSPGHRLALEPGIPLNRNAHQIASNGKQPPLMVIDGN